MKQISVQQVAIKALSLGLSPIPANSDKTPVGPWKQYQKKPMSVEQARQVFRNGTRLALICGKVSGGLELLDIDRPDLYGSLLGAIENYSKRLAGRLLKRRTPSGGYHLIYRCNGQVAGNQKLAMSFDGKETWLETRGEGGYFLSAPSPGYTVIEHALKDLPLLTSKEVEILHTISRSFTEKPEPPRHGNKSNVNGTRPGDDFNNQVNWNDLLESQGWISTGRTGPGGEHWTRPGKRKGTSATLKNGCLYVFSSNAGLPLGSHDAFSVYTHLLHNGDFSSAAKDLAVKGYRGDHNPAPAWSGVAGVVSGGQCGQQVAGVWSKSGQAVADKRSLSVDVLSFIEMDPAPFLNNDVYTELCARNRRERKTITMALSRYEKQGKIKKIEGKRGWWEVVEDEPEVMDLLSIDTESFNLLLPLGISEYVRTPPGSIILVSGSSNAGKTVFLLGVAKTRLTTPHVKTDTHINLNPSFINKREEGLPQMVYQNSEMSKNELVTRIKNFGDDPASWVPHVKFIERSHSFDKLIEPDGVNFVDYLEVNEDFFMAGKYIADIHRKLHNGIAIIAMQKKQGHAFAKGGEMTLEKPRLAINLDKNEPHGFICKITKAKEPVDYMHSIQGMERDYVITKQSEIKPISDWRFVNVAQRRSINSQYERTGLPRRVMQKGGDYRTL